MCEGVALMAKPKMTPRKSIRGRPDMRHSTFHQFGVARNGSVRANIHAIIDSGSTPLGSPFLIRGDTTNVPRYLTTRNQRSQESKQGRCILLFELAFHLGNMLILSSAMSLIWTFVISFLVGHGNMMLVLCIMGDTNNTHRIESQGNVFVLHPHVIPVLTCQRKPAMSAESVNQRDSEPARHRKILLPGSHPPSMCHLTKERDRKVLILSCRLHIQPVGRRISRGREL